MSIFQVPPGKMGSTPSEMTKVGRAKMLKDKVLKVAKSVQGFDQKEGVDNAPEPDKVSIKGQTPKVTGEDVLVAMSYNMMAAIPDKVTGEGTFKDGQVTKLEATTEPQVKIPGFSKPEEFRFEKKDDGTTIYSANDGFGYLTVREQQDGTLFIASGKEPGKDFATLAADDFQPPAPGEKGESGFSVAGFNLSDAATKASDTVAQGSRKLGDLLSDITGSLTPQKEKAGSGETLPPPLPEAHNPNAITVDPNPPLSPISSKEVQVVPLDAPPDPTSRVDLPAPSSPQNTTDPSFQPTRDKEQLLDAAKKGDVVGIVGGGLNDLANVGKSMFKGFFGK